MNKHYITLALLMSTCISTLTNAAIIINTGSDACKSSADTGKDCTCNYNSGLPGKCITKIVHGKQECQCHCEPGSILTGEAADTNPADPKPVPTNFSTYIFSQDITAPIYNLPMQRTLVPLSHDIIDCPWFISVAPYGKTNQKQTIGNANLENIEAGALVQGGYYDSYWFANTIVAFGGTKTDANLANNLNVSHWHIGFSDALFALGLKTNSDSYSRFAANGELFFGVSSNRLDEDNTKDAINKVLFNVGNPSVGVQGDIDWTFAQFNSCKFELSVFSRFTHFFKKTVVAGNQEISYTPGSFVDVLLGFTQYYGSDYQHQFEIGYNPTVRVIKAEALNAQNQPAANLLAPETGKLHHTAYATYSYNWETNGMPMVFSIGGSATVAPHTNTYGTIFGTFGVSF